MKRENLPYTELCCPGGMKTKESKKKKKKRDKKLHPAWELRKLRNILVTVIPAEIFALQTVNKGLEMGQEELKIGGRIETIQTAALLRSTRILRRVLEIWGD